MKSKIIDVHSHPIFESYLKTIGEASSTPETPSRVPSWKLEDHLTEMDENGIEVSILSLPEASNYLIGKDGQTTSRKFNEQLAEYIAKYPTRFGAFATIPMDDMDAAIGETMYALDILKLDGISVSTHFKGVYLGDAKYDALFSELDKRKVTLFVHPTKPEYFDSMNSPMDESVLEFMFDSTRMVASLVLSGTKSKYPNINIISTHAGGTIPFLVNRLMLISQMPWAYKGAQKLSPQHVKDLLGSFYYDLTASTSFTQLDGLLQLVSVDKLLMGFDFPLMPKQTIGQAIKSLENYTKINDEQRDKIYSGNIEKLLPRLSIK